LADAKKLGENGNENNEKKDTQTMSIREAYRTMGDEEMGNDEPRSRLCTRSPSFRKD
jgi:hypothetical protein